MARPETTDYAPFYETYVALVPEDDVLSAMRSSLEEDLALLRGVSEEESLRRHPPYTWSVREVVGHVIDSERVFGYRALRFARGDATPLPGFDQDAYARVALCDRVPLGDLVAEFESLRRSHLAMFGGLPDDAWSRRGVANGVEASVLALASILVGHARHHAAILRRRLAGA